MKHVKPLSGVVFLASLAMAGCAVGAGTPDGEHVATADQNLLSTNRLSTNRLSTNRLSTNRLSTNRLSTNRLSTNRLSTNDLLTDALTDPDAREVFKYIVSCALPGGENVQVTADDGVTYEFDGEIGVAPEWANTACDKNCQEWVSACVISRLDFLGELRDISLRGQNPALGTTAEERQDYSEREATYFGNIFASSGMIIKGCLPADQSEDLRVCGPSIDGCIVDFVGKCDDVCQKPEPDGAYRNCRDGRSVYHGSITVFLQP